MFVVMFAMFVIFVMFVMLGMFVSGPGAMIFVGIATCWASLGVAAYRLLSAGDELRALRAERDVAHKA